MKGMEFVFACKKCKKVFRKDVTEFEDADEYCPHCDNHYIIEAKTPMTEGVLKIEFTMEKGHENEIFKDDRQKPREQVLMQEAPSEKELEELDLDGCD